MPVKVLRCPVFRRTSAALEGRGRPGFWLGEGHGTVGWQGTGLLPSDSTVTLRLLVAKPGQNVVTRFRADRRRRPACPGDQDCGCRTDFLAVCLPLACGEESHDDEHRR